MRWQLVLLLQCIGRCLARLPLRPNGSACLVLCLLPVHARHALHLVLTSGIPPILVLRRTVRLAM